MEDLDKFSKMAALIGEPVRSKMLWSLLDGKAYTATELAVFAEVTSSAASNHLSKLLEAELIKVEVQGRHRYYTFANAEVAYAVEALAHLSKMPSRVAVEKPTGIKYCRTCYDHLAGFVGVQLVEAMEKRGYVRKEGKHYLVTKKGWPFLMSLGIKQTGDNNNRRPLTRQCLDWSERRPHLAGQLGADLLEATLNRKWFRKARHTRELIVTTKGRQEMEELLGLSL